MGNWPTVSRQTGNARLGRERGEGLEGWKAWKAWKGEGERAWKAGGQQAGGGGGVLDRVKEFHLKQSSSAGYSALEQECLRLLRIHWML